MACLRLAELICPREPIPIKSITSVGKDMHALDNVIWHALATRQSVFAETFDQASRFPREVTALAALLEPSPRGYTSLAGLLGAGGTATLSLASPYQPQAGWDVIAAFPGLQMVSEKMVSETGNASSLLRGPDHS